MGGMASRLNPAQQRMQSLFGAPTYTAAPDSVSAAPLAIEAPTAQLTPTAAITAGATPQVKPNFFGQGGMGRYLAGFIGDALTGRPMFAQMQMLQQRQEQDRAAEDRQFARQVQLADYTARTRAQYREPTELQQNYAWLQSQGRQKDADALIARSVSEKPIPVQGFDDAGNQTLTFVYPSSLTPSRPAAQGGAQPPASAIDYLRKNPGLKAQFDQKYGAGSADRYLGGPTATPSGGFR